VVNYLARFNVMQAIRHVSGLCLEDDFDLVVAFIHPFLCFVRIAFVIRQSLNGACRYWYSTLWQNPV
jgi:hypothetical protein